MCLGVPMQLLGRDGIAGLARDGEATEVVDLSLTPDADAGDWILVFLGAAREVMAEAEALATRRALDGLRALMSGGDLGDAFHDLDHRTPTLPPHLQAALVAGHAKG